MWPPVTSQPTTPNATAPRAEEAGEGEHEDGGWRQARAREHEHADAEEHEHRGDGAHGVGEERPEA
jgi:hypothetical protein